MTDSVKRVEDGAVVASLDRSVLRLSQTPQGFRREILEGAREAAGDVDVTDDAQCVEMAGHTVAVVAGEPGNVKLTDASDLALAELRCRRTRWGSGPARESGPEATGIASFPAGRSSSAEWKSRSTAASTAGRTPTSPLTR